MPDQSRIYDIAIIGCGPAGLSAAVNAKIRNKDVALFGGEFCSPKMHKTPRVDNYLGFYKEKGEELRQRFIAHAKDIGLKINKLKVDNIYPMGNEFGIAVKSDIYRAKAVIIATGLVVPKHIQGEQEFLGRGVGYCATCDAPLYKGKDVAVISYSSSEENEVNFLAEICRKVYYIPMYKDMGKLDPRIEVVIQKPDSISGDESVNKLILEKRELDVDGVFILRELIPATQLLPEIEMDGNHIKVNRDMQTSVQGIYSAGDCTGVPYQIAKAVGEGQVAALNCVKYIDTIE
ncbi:MAG: NAD(P)/FAD-dependent oxidoreductase [Clostridia bacterium]|nr:NAD(P)/FAD-dependent oxidoreductase [Clostridia bacterium]